MSQSISTFINHLVIIPNPTCFTLARKEAVTVTTFFLFFPQKDQYGRFLNFRTPHLCVTHFHSYKFMPSQDFSSFFYICPNNVI